MDPERPNAKRTLQDAGFSKRVPIRSLRKDFRPEEKPFACECGRAFTLKGNLRKHQRLHTNEKPFRCEIPGCGKNFTQAVGLRRHIMTHNNEKPYACTAEGCTQAFVLPGNLNVHLRIHTGEKPFVCSYEACNKAFAQRGNLRSHMLYHSNEKPFVCEVEGCSQSFTVKGNLKKHSKIHLQNNMGIIYVSESPRGDHHAPTQTPSWQPKDHYWQQPETYPMAGYYPFQNPQMSFGLTEAQQQFMQQLQYQQNQQLQYFLYLNQQEAQNNPQLAGLPYLNQDHGMALLDQVGYEQIDPNDPSHELGMYFNE